MKRLLLIILCILLTSCNYIGATEDIIIRAPDSLPVNTVETFVQSTQTQPTLTATDENGQIIPVTDPVVDPNGEQLILNTSSKKIHYFSECSYAGKIMDKNLDVVPALREAVLIANGYTVCSWCNKHKNEPAE